MSAAFFCPVGLVDKSSRRSVDIGLLALEAAVGHLSHWGIEHWWTVCVCSFFIVILQIVDLEMELLNIFVGSATVLGPDRQGHSHLDCIVHFDCIFI